MKNQKYREQRRHGRPDFPVQYYHIEPDHPRYEMSLHWHAELEVVRVLSGTLTLYLNNEARLLGAGEVAFVGGGVLHRAEPRDCTYECVVLDPNMLAGRGADPVTGYVRALLAGEVEDRPATREESPLLQAVDRLFEALRSESPYFELRVHAAATEILYGLYVGGRVRVRERREETRHRRQVMLSLLDWIAANYAERITLRDLAAVAGTGEKYLCRFFKEYTGNSPVEYINRLRVERACLDMTEAGHSITRAALDNGFNDMSYFCKIFKRYKGVSPREYRRLSET